MILRRIFESESLFRYMKTGEIEIARAIINIVCDYIKMDAQISQD